MNEPDLLREEARLYDPLCEIAWLRAGFEQVKKNRGAAGIDRVTIADFEAGLDVELRRLREELVSWTYRPAPVRRVEIPNPGGRGLRLLGVPTVRDGVVQATLKLLLEPLFEPHFSAHSYGFRPGRNPHQAVEAAQKIVTSGKPYVVDLDLEKFFDRIHHDRLVARMSQRVSDKRILRLVGVILRSGVMTDGLVSPTQEGAVQGSPLSPLLSNVVLDELDRELERRGLAFCRFADDCNIFAASQKSAERVMDSIRRFIEKRLKLTVNREKSQVARSEKVKFLGFTVVNGTIAIAHKAVQAAMGKVKELTPRGTHRTLETTLATINQWYGGWSSYFSLTQYPSQLLKIEAHLRRRLRSRLIDQQKSRRNLFRKLVTRGVSRRQAANAVFSNHQRWALSNTFAVTKAYPNRWFVQELGQAIRSDPTLPHWFALSRRIRLP